MPSPLYLREVLAATRNAAQTCTDYHSSIVDPVKLSSRPCPLSMSSLYHRNLVDAATSTTSRTTFSFCLEMGRKKNFEKGIEKTVILCLATLHIFLKRCILIVIFITNSSWQFSGYITKIHTCSFVAVTQVPMVSPFERKTSDGHRLGSDNSVTFNRTLRKITRYKIIEGCSKLKVQIHDKFRRDYPQH